MQPADFGSSYYQYHHHPLPQQQNPNPNPSDLPPPPAPLPLQTYASAPPFSSHHYSSSSSSDYSNFPSGYPSTYPQNPDPVLPPTAPSYAPNPNYQSFNPSPAQPQSNFPSFNPAPELGQAPYAPPPTTQQQQQQQTPYYHPSYDHQAGAAPNYNAPVIPPTQNPNSNPNSSFPAPYSGSYSQLGSSLPPVVYDPYESGSVKLEQRGGYLDGNSGGFGGQGGGFGRSQSDLSSDLYEKRQGGGVRYDRSGFRDDGAGDGVYAYDGGKVDPYGARGTSAKSSTWSSSFDDYGRAISNSSGKSSQAGSPKVVRAVPKVEVEQDTKNGVQKFRVKLLAESGGQSSMDVLCQVGLDGIRMLDPNTSRTLRIYPLETVTRSDKTDSSTVAFWSKSSVDIEPRRIRLQSNSYTTNTILDTVTAAIIQFKEMGGKDTISNLSDSGKLSEQSTERKKGLGDWMNLIKPGNEEKDHWVPDEAVKKCTACGTDFGAFVRRHHCRNCGDIFCDKCTHGRIALTADENAQPVRVCDRCLAEVTQRLSNAKESVSKPSRLHSHEDFAKKLQEEMDRNRKSSSGSKSSEGSGKRMREVACPTCTVHLQVQVPASGSETIECGVCQHPFLVSAH